MTKGYGVPGVRVYPISLGPGTGGSWAYQNDWIYVRPELLTGSRLLVLISHELGHVTLGHRPLYVPNVQRTATAVERERAANRRGVEILVKYLGLTEQQALDHYARYFIEYHRDDPDVAALTVDDFTLSRIQVAEFGPIPEAEFNRTYEWMVSWNLIRPGHTANALIDIDR